MSQKYVLVYTNGTYVAEDPNGERLACETTQLKNAYLCSANYARTCINKHEDIANALPVDFVPVLQRTDGPTG